MRKLHFTLALALVFLLVSLAGTHGTAQPFPGKGGQNVQTLFDGSQLVVLGVAEGTRAIGEESQASDGPSAARELTMSSLVRVDEAYKGTAGETIEVRFVTQAPQSVMLGPTLSDGERVLLFLNQAPGGTYGFTDRFWGKFNASGIAGTAAEAGPEGLARDLTRALTGCGAGSAAALDILQGYRHISPETEAQVAQCFAAGSSQLAPDALCVLLAAGGPKYFPVARDFLRAHGASLAGEQIFLLSGRIREFGPGADPLVIADLSDFPNRAIQTAALDALDELKSPATVERILRHLDDPDPVIQWKTFYVLERVTDPHGQNTGGDYSPTVSDFQQNPGHFTRIWKDWWTKSGRAQYAGVPVAH